jgi:methylmalonyl-CoA mutase cobalamin-binding domain/chain
MGKKKIRILLAKAGLDGHDRGVITVAMACKDAGMEVVYGGLHLMPEEIANIAIQEAVDVIGISSLSDAHMTQVPRIIDELKKKGEANIPVILGGFIQPEDIPALKAKGVAEVFGIGTKLDDITHFIQQIAGEQANYNKG